MVAPHLMTGGSDSRHYLDMTANGVYRFFPLFVNLTARDVERIHGLDERIKVPSSNSPPELPKSAMPRNSFQQLLLPVTFYLCCLTLCARHVPCLRPACTWPCSVCMTTDVTCDTNLRSNRCEFTLLMHCLLLTDHSGGKACQQPGLVVCM